MINKLKMVENELTLFAKEEKDSYRKHWILGLKNTIASVIDDINGYNQITAQDLIDEGV